MFTYLKKFRADESGAITVDWVVLTAAIIGLAVAGVVAAQTGVISLAGTIGTAVSSTSTSSGQ
ncbi:hypothetical protein KUD11_03310 [Roseovarius sp. LXJ103]|uniref:Flp family type IVb pilin n=1 Tax=Roseovarius carneus TaxID=2853164 RepID=UPI000D62026A|nr:hypothetical protein [Roseovarius carneus]MBZ8117671.1 hypothetical protein [Roseovarius carneus]PWE36552.1 hypothetical protein DD563_11635 [Pelagicola sp. LXJ1103]